MDKDTDLDRILAEIAANPKPPHPAEAFLKATRAARANMNMPPMVSIPSL